MNLLYFLIAINSPAMDCDYFSKGVSKLIADMVTKNQCNAMCKAVVSDNPEIIGENVINLDRYQAYGLRVCTIYNRIVK